MTILSGSLRRFADYGSPGFVEDLRGHLEDCVDSAGAL